MADHIGKAIDDLITMTKSVIQHAGEVDETFIELLEERNRQFAVLESMAVDLSTAQSEGSISITEVHRTSLRELYDLHKQAEAQVAKYKRDISEQIKRIAEAKHMSSTYGEGRVARSSTKRVGYQAAPEAAFFDKKK